MRDWPFKKYWFPALLLVLFALAGATRVFGAWCLRLNLNPDAGVVALMAKHIAEGRDFPVFFYGQAYMGSFEPLISAALCRLFGCSGFMVCLGTALLGLATLPFVYLWARDLASARAAGIAALAWCLVGPGGYFHYQVSPRGGYAAAIFFGTLVLWLSGRLIVRERLASLGSFAKASQASPGGYARASQNNPPRWPWYLLLGFAAGLGWWSNQLVTAALAAAALLCALLIPFRRLLRCAPAAAGGFLLGSLPFWWWNAANHWASFEFAGSFGQFPMGEGLGIFFLDRWPGLLDWPAAALGAVLAAAGMITAGVVVNAGRQRRTGPDVFGLLFFVFILFSALLFSTSHFAAMNTERYLLPLVPALAVMLGVMTARFQAWLPAGLAWTAWLPLLALIGLQTQALAWPALRMRGEEDYQRQIESVVSELRARQVGAAFIPYSKYAWNFAVNETFAFSLLPVDRYPPYSRRAELADRIAIFEHEGGIAEFFEAYGGSARRETAAGIFFHAAFAPPAEARRELAPAGAGRILDSLGRDALAATTDCNLETGWESAAPEGHDEWVEITFQKPERVCQLRLLFFPTFPAELQIEGRDPGGNWRPLTPVMPSSPFYWSGPRPYCSDWLYRLNAVFPATTLEALRLRKLGVKCGISEMRWFAPATEPAPAEMETFPELLRLLRDRGLNRLYCDRWVANALHRACGTNVQVPLDPVFFDAATPRLDCAMRLTPQTGVLARREDAGLCREALAQRLLPAQETPLGPWILFEFTAANGSGISGDDPGLQWAGFGCFLARNKTWAATLAGRADALCQAGKLDQAIDLARRAERAYPNYHPVIERLADWLKTSGQTNEAAAWQCQNARLSRPEIPARICFRNGVTFRGLTLSSRQARPGDTLTVRYYWQHPLRPPAPAPQVFVHFQGKAGLFQDDHGLERPAAAANQPLPEVFVEERKISVPADLPAGRYELNLGLFLPQAGGRRIRAETSLPGHHNAFTLPVVLEVIPRGT